MQVVRKDAEYDFEKVRYRRQRTDELTDVSERLPLPMCNSFEYTFEADGELYFQEQPIGKILRDGEYSAREMAQHDPLFHRMHLHTLIELNEYDDMRRLALGTDSDPDILVVMSPKVAEIGKHLTMVRIYQRTLDGITATSLSFDESDVGCLNAIANTFGVTIPLDTSPEDIMQQYRLRGRSDDFDSIDIRQEVARRHDEILAARHGGSWSGGRRGEYTLDAMTFALAHEDMLSDHMASIREIQRVYRGQELREKLERQRYDYAASLARRLRGDGDLTTMGAAGDIARSQGESYENSCPDGSMSVQQGLDALGLGTQRKREWQYGDCRVCLRAGMVGECAVCSSCESADNRGEDLSEIHKRALAAVAAYTDDTQEATYAAEKSHVLNSAHRVRAKQYIKPGHRRGIGIGGMVDIPL